MLKKSDIWAEKYRPVSLDDCILDENIKTYFQNMINSGNLDNMIFYGTSGNGKTTLAKVLAIQTDMDYFIINASLDRNMDTLRDKVQAIATSKSLTGKKKLIILDESDYLNSQSVQPALRGLIEKTQANCRYIFTCNDISRIHPAIQSRCNSIHFNSFFKDMRENKFKILERIEKILRLEKVEFERNAVGLVINNCYPDIRNMLISLQFHYRIHGKIVKENIDNSKKMDELVVLLHEKNFDKLNQWTMNNTGSDLSNTIRNIYNTLLPLVENKSILVILTREALRDAAKAIDKNICLMGYFMDLQEAIEWN